MNQHSPMGDELDALLRGFFVMRAATPDMTLDEIKLRNELGEPIVELKQAIQAHINQHYISREQAARDMAEVVGEYNPKAQGYGERITINEQRQRAQAKGYDVSGKERQS